MNRCGNERGVALIIVLGLVALISSWAVTAAYEDQLSLRRSENSQNYERAALASRSALALAIKILRDDAAASTTDDLTEMWAQEGSPFPIDDGSVSGHIVDVNRMLNLNALVDTSGMAVPEVVGYVKALFRGRELNPLLVDALVDWMDADHQTYGRGGVEDSGYLGRGYRIKNRHLDRWQELLLVQGFDAAVLRKLEGLVVVAPVAEIGMKVNINTAPVEVLMALVAGMSKADATAWIAHRPFASVTAALQGQRWAAAANSSYMSVVSDAFMVEAEAHFGHVMLCEIYLLERQSAQRLVVRAIERVSRFRHLQANMMAGGFHG